MSYPHYDQVTRSHSELVAEGKIKRRTTQEEVEQDKGLLTRRAGWYSNQENDPNVGILQKNYGNQSEGYSVDILVYRDGTFYDVASDADMMAIPMNIGPHGPDADLAARWAQPTAELAQIDSGTGGGPGPGLPSGGGDDILATLDEIVAMLNRAQEVEARNTASIIARDDLNTQRILDRLDQIVRDLNETAQRVLVIWLAQRAPGTGEPPEGGGILPGEPGTGQNALLLLLLKMLTGERQ